MSKKILTVVGARPQFIKASVLSRTLQLPKYKEFDEVIVHTGQHYDFNMSRSFFEELSIPKPYYNLSVGSGSHGEQTGLIITGMEKILKIERPDLVLVYGDTNTTLGAALSTAKTQYKLAHVEAGLRSHRRGMPEEVNRVVTDTLSDLLFCPTEAAQSNLLKEGKDKECVFFSGDIMLDSFLFYVEKAKKLNALNNFKLNKNDYILATVHRAENTDDFKKLESILSVLRKVAKNIKVVLPLHPRTQKIIELHSLSLDGIQAIDPLPYISMMSLLINSRVIITDSGGVQKEAYFSRVPCITIRDETEWMETCESGWNVLAPVLNIDNLYRSIINSIDSNTESLGYYSFYGDGNAAQSILDNIDCNI